MNSRRGASEQERIFAFGPFAGKQDCWYEHVPTCQDDPHCFRGTCGLSHPERDAKSIRWEWVYPKEWFEHRPMKESTPAPTERAFVEARQYWDQVEKDIRAFDPWGWNNATIRQNLSYTDHLATPLPSTQATLPEVQTPASPQLTSPEEPLLSNAQKPFHKRAPSKKKSSDTESTDAKFTESKLDLFPIPTQVPTQVPTPITPTTTVSMELEKVQVPQADSDSLAVKAHNTYAPSTLESSYESKGSKDAGRLMFLEMSDDESSASEGLSFTLRGGRADTRPTRRSMPENQPVIDPTKEMPKGYLGKLLLFIHAIFAVFVAFGEAILEGTGACFFRLGDFFSKRGLPKRKSRERRPSWKKRSS